MHSKIKGNIGEFETAAFLAKHEFAVFTEQGDNSKIDIIAEKNGKLYRIQCKALTPKNGAIAIPMRKAGPNYIFNYESHMFDIFSAYDLENDKLYFVSSEVLNTHKKCFKIRIQKSRQSKNVNFAENFLAEKWMEDIS